MLSRKKVQTKKLRRSGSVSKTKTSIKKSKILTRKCVVRMKRLSKKKLIEEIKKSKIAAANKSSKKTLPQKSEIRSTKLTPIAIRPKVSPNQHEKTLSLKPSPNQNEKILKSKPSPNQNEKIRATTSFNPNERQILKKSDGKLIKMSPAEFSRLLSAQKSHNRSTVQNVAQNIRSAPIIFSKLGNTPSKSNQGENLRIAPRKSGLPSKPSYIQMQRNNETPVKSIDEKKSIIQAKRSNEILGKATEAKTPLIQAKRSNETKTNEVKKQIQVKRSNDTPVHSVEKVSILHTKRTPKPNPKYLNESLITAFKGENILKKSYMSSSDDDENSKNDSDSDISTEFSDDSDASSFDEEDDDQKTDQLSKTKALNTPVNRRPPPTKLNTGSSQKPGNLEYKKLFGSANKQLLNKQKPSSLLANFGNRNATPMHRLNRSTSPSIENRTIVRVPVDNFAPKRKPQFPLEKKMTPVPSKQVKPTETKPAETSTKQSRFADNMSLLRKRKLDDQTVKNLRSKRAKSEDSDSDYFLDDDNVNDSDNEETPVISPKSSRQQIRILQKTDSTQALRSAQDKNKQSLLKKPETQNKNLQQTKSSNLMSTSVPKEKQKQLGKKETEQKVDIKDTSESETDIFASKSGGAATLEDFETMPTFTIVNINDIIGKKGNLVKNKASNDTIATSSKSGGTTSPEPSTEKMNSPDEHASTPASTAARNRRKTMHTTILSDKIEKSKSPPPKSTFPPSRKASQITSKNKASAQKLSPISSISKNQSDMKLFNNNNDDISSKISPRSRQTSISPVKKNTSASTNQNKGPPRILNSMVGKKTTPITTFNTKMDTRRSSDDNSFEQTPQSNENIFKNQSSFSNKLSENEKQIDNKNSNIAAIKRKLPSEKIVIQRQGNKIIKKITCFETWYVINIPQETLTSEKENNLRNSLKIPLIQLANEAKSLDLPNPKWTCKVSLQKCTQSILLQMTEKYTGDIYDDYIKPEEIDKYRPTNVMFRRVAAQPTPKVPYDRAVIFKNDTFFTNIEGKNVRLIGAPHQIDELKDIEILLDLVDELNLQNQFVEQASYVP